ncbi:phosphate starvation-inducible protein PhoH [Candidatus Poribacteria bacterium]|nr:MAG: phosphate starvation-inducible protein PhoH [Candidatus Poribacteria bacterium]
MEKQEIKGVPIQNNAEVQALFGNSDEFLKIIEDDFDVRVVLKSDSIAVLGDNQQQINRVISVLESLLYRIRKGERILTTDINYLIRASESDDTDTLDQSPAESIPVFSKRGVIRPKTSGQKRYVEAIKNNDLVFGIGPAGTGKTYLAMAMAVSALKNGQVSRIILTRPAVEAGERLGFLPGDIAAKVDPYLRPLYDALYDMMPPDSLDNYIERNIIEVAPIAFMRGRTLNNSFVVLDEAQNATIEQMKMFLTRLGFDSKAVVTGDITQTDLPTHKTSGLADAQNVLDGIKGIHFIYFSKVDVVRHELVQRIIEAYERTTPTPEVNEIMTETKDSEG